MFANTDKKEHPLSKEEEMIGRLRSQEFLLSGNNIFYVSLKGKTLPAAWSKKVCAVNIFLSLIRCSGERRELIQNTRHEMRLVPSPFLYLSLRHFWRFWHQPKPSSSSHFACFVAALLITAIRHHSCVLGFIELLAISCKRTTSKN